MRRRGRKRTPSMLLQGGGEQIIAKAKRMSRALCAHVAHVKFIRAQENLPLASHSQDSRGEETRPWHRQIFLSLFRRL
jgi:hypothetical protein